MTACRERQLKDSLGNAEGKLRVESSVVAEDSAPLKIISQLSNESAVSRIRELNE